MIFRVLLIAAVFLPSISGATAISMGSVENFRSIIAAAKKYPNAGLIEPTNEELQNKEFIVALQINAWLGGFEFSSTMNHVVAYINKYGESDAADEVEKWRESVLDPGFCIEEEHDTGFLERLDEYFSNEEIGADEDALRHFVLFLSSTYKCKQ